jgi:hypothetical protein
MPKIIFTSRYTKNVTAAQGRNLIRYVATRDGVEVPRIIDTSRPATLNQQRLIDEVVRAAPDVKDSFEYQDYTASPTIGNASDFITAAFEDNPVLWSNVRNYVDYIAKRPGAARSKIVGHGLWNGGENRISLSQAVSEIANHKGNLWTHVLSLRRADAEQMGYDNADAWRELVKGKIPVIADAMKIPIADLRWYAAFHNKASNPHIHLIVYSQNPSHSYLIEPGIEKMRSAFATEIYKNELIHIYERKDAARTRVNVFASERLRELAAQIDGGGADLIIADMLAELSARLKRTSGKKQYGYLKPDVKQLVDAIVERLAADLRIAEMYRHWCDLNADIRRVYTSHIPEPPSLADEKTFRSIKNIAIRYAMEGGSAQSHEDGTPAPGTHSFAGQTLNLLRHLCRIIRDDYQGKQRHFEQAVDSKLLQKIRRKKQDLGIKME